MNMADLFQQNIDIMIFMIKFSLTKFLGLEKNLKMKKD